MFIIKDNKTYNNLIQAFFFFEDHEECCGHSEHTINSIRNNQQKEFVQKIGKLVGKENKQWVRNAHYEIWQSIARVWEVEMSKKYPCEICQNKANRFFDSHKGWICRFHFETKFDRYQRKQFLQEIGLQMEIEVG